MKTTVIRYQCDLCGKTAPTPNGTLIGSWVVLTFGDPNTRCDTFEKHVCDECAASIVKTLGDPAKK